MKDLLDWPSASRFISLVMSVVVIYVVIREAVFRKKAGRDIPKSPVSSLWINK